MAEVEHTGVSKSAKRRAAKKARDEAGEEAPAPEPAPAPKAVPKAKAKAAAEPAAPEPKAKAKAKAKAAAAAPEPVAEPKAKAKGAAKAKAKSAPEPKKEEPKAAKAKAAPKAQPAPVPAPEPKQAAKAKAQPKQTASKSAAKKPVKKEEVEEAPKEKLEIVQPFEMDDGKDKGGWEMTTGVSKKQQKRQEKLAFEKAQAAGLPANQKAIPGLALPGQHIPGMAAPTGQSAQDAVKATLAAAKAAGAAAGSAARAAMEAEGQKAAQTSSATIKVPDEKIGMVIGPKGATIKLIQEKTGVTRIDTSGDVFVISGPPEAVALAEHAIEELIKKGYCSMAYDDFKEEFVAVYPTCFPDLIGKEGVTIKAMKKELGVEVNIPPVPKSAKQDKKYKVTLAGKKENVERAKEVITHIAMYGYHEATHEGFTHEEMEVPGWCYSFLIGKAGSELKHIQNNFKVKVNIPREHSLCQNVVVVGAKHDVERAKTYIEKVLWNAENQSRGRDRQDGAADDGGDEVEEDWMKQYMYRRK
jgi:rRNA processing protein Krr1/Pno1